MIGSLKLIAAVLVICTLGAGAFAGDFGPLKGAKCGSGGKSVVVFLPGDASRGGPATYHCALMRQRAQEGVTAIVLLRPGDDDAIQTSAGAPHERRDQDTKANNDLVAKSWSAVKDANPGERLGVAGHTDGAAQLGAIIERYPGLVNSAMLQSCPCDIKIWRAKYSPFSGREKQSPIKFAGTIGQGMRVIALTGAEDDNMWPGLAEAYVGNVKSAGTPARFVKTSGANHWNGTLQSAVVKTMIAEATR